jgi:hypothetical protein
MTRCAITRQVWIAALVAPLAACIDIDSGVLSSKEESMVNPLSAPSQPSPPHVAPIEHGGVRYEQDVARQRQPDAQRGGWLVAIDAASGTQLWSVQLYANPYDAASPVGSPPRWFKHMQLMPGGAGIDIEDDIGTRFTVDLSTHTVTVRQSPLINPPRPEDKRPKFD